MEIRRSKVNLCRAQTIIKILYYLFIVIFVCIFFYIYWFSFVCCNCNYIVIMFGKNNILKITLICHLTKGTILGQAFSYKNSYMHFHIIIHSIKIKNFIYDHSFNKQKWKVCIPYIHSHAFIGFYVYVQALSL